MYSQNNEEQFILSHFENANNGRFLDIGAFDGKTFSNTLALLERGWSGVMVEPSPSVIPALHKNIEQYAGRVTVIEKAIVTGESGVYTFHDSQGDAVGTLNDAHRDKWSTAIQYRPLSVIGINVNEFFDLVGFNFDFVNIDIEGNNLELIKAINWEKMQSVSMICVEHDYKYSEIGYQLAVHGFKEILRNSENMIFTRRVIEYL